jgi:cell division septation protein DedD
LAEKESASLSGDLLARKGAASSDGFTLADAAVTRTSIESSYRWRLVIISATIALSFAAVTFVGAALFYGERWMPAVHTERVVVIPPSVPSETSFNAAARTPVEAEETARLPKPVAESLLAAVDDKKLAEKAPPPDALTGVEAIPDPVKPVLTAVPSANSPKPLATAVATDVSRQHASKIETNSAETPSPGPESPKIPASAGESKPPERLLANVDPNLRPAAKEPPRPKKRPRYAPRTAYRVQIHALGSDAAVRREWRRLKKRHRGLFSGLNLKVAPKRTGAGKKTVYRMQLGALPSRGKAKALCRELQRRKMNCIVVRERS